MALHIPFFMAPEDEQDVLRRLSHLRLELWPELTFPQHRPPVCGEDTRLVDPAYYLAAGDVIAYPLKRGQNRGRWKIDEVNSPVVYFSRSQLDEEGQLRSGYFWAETETGGDQSRIGGKPSRFLHAVRELQETVKSRFRRSSPVKGTIYLVGPAAARLAQAGTPLREAGRKGELVRVHR
jgi:hypothetical protein